MKKALLVPALGLAACGSPERPASAARPAAPATPAETFQARCSTCHQPYDPSSRTAAQWDKDLERMKDRAGLAPDQVEAVRLWLHAGAAK